MSMISAQCDELRDAAKRGGLVVGLPQMLNEAADLILELRDDLQRANDAVRDAEHDESMVWDRVRKAEAESAKLRSELESVGTAAYLYGRGDLQAENAKLREELADVSKCETCEAMLDCDECLRANDSQKERKRIAFENAKLRELCIDFASMLTYAELDGLRVEATIGGVTKTYDASELCDKVEEICDKED